MGGSTFWILSGVRDSGNDIGQEARKGASLGVLGPFVPLACPPVPLKSSGYFFPLAAGLASRLMPLTYIIDRPQDVRQLESQARSTFARITGPGSRAR